MGAASYDAAGNMVCRAAVATTCGSGNQQLSYDALGQLIAWQNASGSSEQYAYDGSGQRVWQQASSTSGSTTTTTDTTYVLGVEEVTSTSVTGQQPTTNTTSYYGLPGGLSASRDSSGLVVQMADLLGTPIAALNLATGMVGEQLRTPYGQARYSASASSGGGMHTSYGFTGQREDTQAPGSSGLDYFNARYYDATVGQFTSADPTMPDLGSPWGTDPYGYVGGQVENATDPTGHAIAQGADEGLSGTAALHFLWAQMQHDALNNGTMLAGLARFSPSTYEQLKQYVEFGLGTSGLDVLAAQEAYRYLASFSSDYWNASAANMEDATRLTALTTPVILGVAGRDGPSLTTDEMAGFSGEGINEDAYNEDVTYENQFGAEDTAGENVTNEDGLAAPHDEQVAEDTGGDGPGSGQGSSGDGSTVPTDLFRSGNNTTPITSTTPRVAGVSSNPDVFPDGAGKIGPEDVDPDTKGPAGISLWDSAGGQRTWFKLPAGTKLPPGLRVVQDSTDATHWVIQPASRMGVDTYTDLLRQITGWVKMW